MSAADLTVINDILAQMKAKWSPKEGDADFWEFFTATELLRDYSLDPDDIRSGVVADKKKHRTGSDGGIDSIYLLVNGVLLRDIEQTKDLSQRKGIILDVIIIQSKRGGGTFDLPPINRIGDTCDDIFRIDRRPSDFSEPYNARLMDSIIRFRAAYTALVTRRPEINVSIFYAARASTSGINGTLINKGKKLEATIKNMLPTISACSFQFKGAREFIELWNKPRKFEFKLPCYSSIDDGKGGWLVLTELGDYFNLITESGAFREFLFESNVRDYAGENDVNQSIRATLDKKDSGADF